jgi:hypothetical protein
MDNTRLDDELQRIFDEMMQSYIRPSTFNAHNRRNMRTETTNQPDTGYLENSRLLNALNDTMNSYNSNMYHYQSNMQSFLQIIQTMAQDRSAPSTQYYAPPRTFRQNTIPIPNTPRATANAQRARQNNQTHRDATTHLFSYLIYPISDLSGNFMRTNPLRDVLVTPTQHQIDNATVNYSYVPELQLTNISCPITLEDFQQGDNVRQIRQCGHTFREPAIQNWFRQNVRCPVCRYDIRDYVAPTQEQDREDENEYEEPILNRQTIRTPSPIHRPDSPRASAFPDLSNNISRISSLQNIETEIVRNISQSINSILNSAIFNDISNTLMYEFEIPIQMPDTSENTLDIDPVD